MPARPETTEQSVAPDVLKAVIDAYYPDAVRGGSQARSRATAAQSLSSLLVGSFVGLVSLAGFADSATVVRTLGFISALSWTVVCLLYLRAVAAPVELVDGGRKIESPDEIVRTILTRSKAERDAVDKRQAIANVALIVALALTAVTIALATFLPQPKEWRTAIFSPSKDQRLAISALCANAMPQLHGKIDKNSLSNKTIYFRTNCDGKEMTFELEASALKQLVLVDE